MTATATVSKPLNLRQFAAELGGEHPMELHDGTLTVEGVPQAALDAALAAHRAQPEPEPEPVEEPPSLTDRLAAVEAEVRGMRERAAAVAATGGAAAVRDAITGPAR